MSTQKERPILMKGEMVRAILDGRKTQTRRIVKSKVSKNHYLRIGKEYSDGYDNRGKLLEVDRFSTVCGTVKCPFGSVGDRLWVKETFSWCAGGMAAYRATDQEPPRGSYFNEWPPKWKSSLFMPRAASRITLEIENVRIERLNDISEEDAASEGIGDVFADAYLSDGSRAKVKVKKTFAFRRLWESINGPGSWGKNPWVWVIEFRRPNE